MSEKQINTNHHKFKHGWAGTPEYTAWFDMIARCVNPQHPSWENYGGRGIVVAAEYAESFLTFLADVAERPSAKHSLDRIDNEKGYIPGNIRWATSRQQHRNKRTNVMLTFNSETMCMEDWAKVLGLKPTTIQGRLKAGWSVEQALSTPPTHNPPRPKVFTLLTHQGKTQRLIDWAKELGIKDTTLGERLRSGWSVEQALMTPVEPRKRRHGFASTTVEKETSVLPLTKSMQSPEATASPRSP